MSNKNKGTKPSAYIEAENLLTAYIRNSTKYPFVCNNIALTQIKNDIQRLKEIIGDIELAARRADAHGTANKQEDCIDRDLTQHGE